VIPDTNAVPPANFYLFPGSSQFRQIDAFGSLSFDYPINFSYSSSDVDTTGVFKGFCDIDFRPAPIEIKDFIRKNDSTESRAVLSNYYAYDDGTAEAGFGINAGNQGGSTTYLAVRFDMPFQDTIGGVQLYFLPQQFDIRPQSFKLTVWSSLSPPNIIFQQEVRSRAIYDEKDAYITYFFDSLVIAGPTFYIGYEKTGLRSMNLGYDFNNNNRDKVLYSLNGQEWLSLPNSIFDGSIMMRPILRKKNFGVGLTPPMKYTKEEQALIYPNPTKGNFWIKNLPEQTDEIRLIAIDGKLIRTYRASNTAYSVEGIQRGIYLLQIVTRDGRMQSSKLLIGN
jgi:hypothetical protein